MPLKISKEELTVDVSTFCIAFPADGRFDMTRRSIDQTS